MGSKRKLAKLIVDRILKDNPKAEYFYDLFGGGGAISLYALQQEQLKGVLYNELNTGICKLLAKVRDDGVNDEFYEWVDRETFKERKDGDCWKSGLAKVIWSFGNNSEKGYLYGKKIEKDKELLHNVIINKCEKSIEKLNEKYGTEFNVKFLEGDLKDVRGRVKKEIKDKTKIRMDFEHLERLQHLERIEHLERIGRFERSSLRISNKSYLDVKIKTPIEKTIIYLDPPYVNTATYQKDISHETLREYIDKSPYKIYVSSYEFDGLDIVLEKEHMTLLSATSNKKTKEILFTNKKGVLK